MELNPTLGHQKSLKLNTEYSARCIFCCKMSKFF